MKKRIARLEEQVRQMNEKYKKEHKAHLDGLKEKAKVEKALSDEKDKSEKLKEKLKKDYRTSSESSMMNPNHPPIQNGRTRTGRKPGGQPEHEHHGRKKLKAATSIYIPDPEEYLDTLKYKPTGKVIAKQ